MYSQFAFNNRMMEFYSYLNVSRGGLLNFCFFSVSYKIILLSKTMELYSYSNVTRELLSFFLPSFSLNLLHSERPNSTVFLGHPLHSERPNCMEILHAACNTVKHYFIIWRRCYSVDNITSYKSYDHTCNNTLARRCNAIDNVRVNNAFSCW